MTGLPQHCVTLPLPKDLNLGKMDGHERAILPSFTTMTRKVGQYPDLDGR